MNPELVFIYAATSIASLCLLIGFHEFGHFIVAKITGVRVIRFSIGFGPVLFSRKIGETEYALSAVPLGGYVKMAGEELALEGGEDQKVPHSETFSAKPVWKRFLIIFAGPGFNILLGFLLTLAVSFFYGEKVLTNVVGNVAAGSLAEQAGILPGDKIVRICVNSDLSNCVSTPEWPDTQRVIKESPAGKTLNFVIERICPKAALCPDVYVFSVLPEKTEVQNVFGEKVEAYIVRIGPSPPINDYRGGLVKKAMVGTYNDATLIILSVKKLLSGKVSAKNIGGPVAIGKIAGDSWRVGGLENFLGFIAFLSINIGIMNFLPIPVLDGGYLLIFLPYEAVFRRPMNERARNLSQAVGIALLLALMGFAFWNDIVGMVVGQ